MKLSPYKVTGTIGGVALRAYARRPRPMISARQVQADVLTSLIERAKDTGFGRDHDFGHIRSVGDYQAAVPLRRYDDFWNDYWSDPFPHLIDTTWPGTIRYFARSSGTTTGDRKHIPCSDEMVKAHNRAGTEVLLEHLRNRPDSKVARGRTFLFGGSPNLDELTPGVHAGELSGIAARETPRWAGTGRYYPDPDLAAITDWEHKTDRIANNCVGQDIRSISGVPSWLQVLFDRTFAANDIDDRRLVSLFPDLELISHGGISFAPYADAFAELLAGSHAETREVYAASEGFMAIADRGPGDGLRILVDNGLFYEFIPADQLDDNNPDRVPLADVELDIDYAIALSTCAGLWAYLPGDLVRFVDLDPHRILVAGRTSQTLSAFGEHITGELLETSIASAATATNLHVRDFSVAPVFLEQSASVGHHRFVIEADAPLPHDFAQRLDDALATGNADYRSKRANNVMIGPPEIIQVPPGTFERWMIAQGKGGGQHKAPRVATTEVVDSITAAAP